jgi:LPS O-antigen subunit length determinant protein (WzzB/FepE family)
LVKEKNKTKILREQIKQIEKDLNNEKNAKIKLNINLEEANKKIKELTNQLSNNLNFNQNNKIIELQKRIDMKNQEIIELYAKIKDLSDNGVHFMPGDKIIGIGFISVDQKIQNYIRAYKDTEIFSRIEEDLYNEYPEFKDKETYLMFGGNKIKRFKTLKENNIKNGDVIQVHIYDDEI